MTSRPTHGTTAGSAYLALRKKASEQDRSTAELLQLYALEGFLARLAVSLLGVNYIHPPTTITLPHPRARPG